MNLIYRLLLSRYKKSAKAYQRPPNQAELLLGMIEKNKNSAYGKAYGFSEIKKVEDYQKKVPIVRYENLTPWIERIRLGESSVLTTEKVLLFEPTGGSSGHHQWIPYTKTLKQQFQHAIEAWLYDIYHSYPGLADGKSYWMITPPFPQEQLIDSVVPIGFEEDGDYLGSLGKRLVNRLLVKPQIKQGMSTEDFYQATLKALLEEADLRVMSFWNPSLLLGLTDYLKQQPDIILKQLQPKRRQEVRRGVYRQDYSLIWPKLGLISCWADAQAKADAKEVRKRFPDVIVQPKGLLSTECVVSFPTKESLAHGGMMPAYASTFFEFRLGDDIYTLDELEDGCVYEQIMTTGGGFYRYTSGDLVRVTGRLNGIPLLRFEGRLATVDLVGEKLSHRFVEEVFSDHAGFYLLTPDERGYTFYSSTPISPPEVEVRLGKNHHYRLARQLGQLHEAKVFLVSGDAMLQYFENCRRFGQRLGDIKPVHLSSRSDFRFQGKYVK